jgi:hypothetical protein
MNVSALLPSSTLNQTNSLQSASGRGEFQQLTQALQSGNLATAQQAFSALTNHATGSSLQAVLSTKDLNALGSALQSGNLNGARSLYSSVQQSLQNLAPIGAQHHRAHHGRGEALSLTSGFPDTSAGSETDVFEPVNLTA